MKQIVILPLLLISAGLAAAHSVAGEHTIFWTTGDRLLPAWGFYPNGSSYGGTSPSGKASAWTAGGGTHTLTWVADFPADAAWQVWVRQYGGYGKVTVTINEQPVVGGGGGLVDTCVAQTVDAECVSGGDGDAGQGCAQGVGDDTRYGRLLH